MEPEIDSRVLISEMEYLEIDKGSNDAKYEFDGSEIMAMAGASPRHNAIQSNLIGEIRNKLRSLGKDCNVLGSDQRVKASLPQSGNKYYYPDISVFCEGISHYEEDTLVNPVLIIEILSDSTRNRDREDKWDDYRRVPSLKDYILVSQEKKKIEVFSRIESGEWSRFQIIEEEGNISITGLDIQISIDEIYYNIPDAPQQTDEENLNGKN